MVHKQYPLPISAVPAAVAAAIAIMTCEDQQGCDNLIVDAQTMCVFVQYGDVPLSNRRSYSCSKIRDTVSVLNDKTVDARGCKSKNDM